MRSKSQVCYFSIRAQARALFWNYSYRHRSKMVFGVFSFRLWEQGTELETVKNWRIRPNTCTYCRFENSTVVRFRVVNELDVDIYVGTSFMNCHVRGILLSLRKNTSKRSKPVYIIARERRAEKRMSSAVLIDMLIVTKLSYQDEVYVERQKVILQRPESFVLVVISAAGLRAIKWKPLMRVIEHVIFVRCVAHILLLVPFHVSVTNFPNQPILLQIMMVIAHGAKIPTLW